jgi:molybdopterin converting factor small subunit
VGTQEFYAHFSAAKLRTLISTLEAQENKALDEIERKYAAQRARYQDALQRAKDVAAANQPAAQTRATPPRKK